MFTLDAIKKMEKMREQAREAKQVAEEKAMIISNMAPRLSKEDREQIEVLMEKVRSQNQFTFEFMAEYERLKAQPGNEYLQSFQVHGPGEYTYSNYHDAARYSWRDKQTIKGILEKYKHFTHHYPLPGLTQLNSKGVELSYNNVDPEVLKIDKQLETMRNYSEEEIVQLKKRGVNMNYYFGITKEDGGLSK